MFVPLLNNGCTKEPTAFNSQLPGLTTMPPALFVQPAEPDKLMLG